MKDDRVYLLHIRDSIAKIRRYTEGGEEQFFEDDLTQDAVVRNLEIIGEAVKNLSDTLKSRRPDIPWRRIAGTRDIVIHQYFGVNYQTVWDIVETQLTEFEQAVKGLLSEMESAG